jgi:hypothetical protein
MVKVTNDFGDRYSGKVGESGVFASIWGIQYRRRYVKPSNPNTPAQQKVRNSFTNGVDKWHAFNAIQAQAYTPMASGLKMSGYNLFLSRWQKMTTLEKSSYVAPIDCIKQISSGPANTGESVNIAEDTPETDTGGDYIVRGTPVFTKGGSSLDPTAFVDIKRGKIYFIKAAATPVTISYTSGGLTVVDEEVAASASQGDIVELKNFDIDYKSVALKVNGTEVDAIEVDVNAGKFFVTLSTTFTGGSSIEYSSYIPLPDANIKMQKVNTNFNTLNEYTNVFGEARFAQTTEDGNRDINYIEPDHLTIVQGNVTPANACADELIVMTPI